MTNEELKSTLDRLLSLPKETEVVEFKKAANDFDFSKLGQYFSALSNEANLRGMKEAWLFFGVRDKDHRIVGSNYRLKGQWDLNSLKKEIADKLTNRISFKDIYILNLPEGRVVMFQIPAAPRGIPIPFENHYYDRDGESIVGLNIEKIERIRSQTGVDWSAEIVSGATIADLDEEAIEVARKNYRNKFPSKVEEMKNWDTIKFLDKTKVTIKGKITRTALVLLGKDESEHFLNPCDVKIRWKLVDEQGKDVDYEIFGIPFLLSVEKIFAKIRNIKYRYMQEGSIFPGEVSQYEPFSIREALNNCIAHQDYTRNGRINVIEKKDQLIFTNLGTFIPGDVEKVVKEDTPPEYYRNTFLVAAMFNLKMVDTAGGGIKKMFDFQRERYFPLPDYDLSDERVKVTLTGKIIDLDYARLLAKNKELTLSDIIMLDKVQKKKELTTDEERHLKKAGLIEGRKPNFYISLKVAQKTGQKAVYSKNRGLDKKYYLDFIMEAIKTHGKVSRPDIDELLWKKLPDRLSDKQKRYKVGNLLSELRRQGLIENVRDGENSFWQKKVKL